MNGLAAWRNSPYHFVYRWRPESVFMSFVGCRHVFTFLALQLFIQSKRLHGVRWPHILRVYAHATLPAALAPATWCACEIMMDVTLLFIPFVSTIPDSCYLAAGRIIFGLGVVVVWANLWIGYRRHLRMPRGWGVAALSLAVGALSALTALLTAGATRSL